MANAADLPAPVLESIPVVGSTAPIPTLSGLTSALSGILKRPDFKTSGVWVGDPATGATLLDANATTALMPASALKLLTAATALRILTPTKRIATRVVAEGTTATLIGGGDAMLESTGAGPTLETLAKRVASQIQTGPITLNYDTSLFSGRTLGAGWSKSFPLTGVAAPVMALTVNQGRAKVGGNARVANPAEHAAQLFAKELRTLGVKVTAVTQAVASASATEIARVESVPVQQLVNHMLTNSDNDLAEALAHLSGVALTGKGTFASGATAMLATAKELNLPTAGMALFDGSGLSNKDRVSAQALGEILMLASQGSFRGIAPALAIAGFTGTLADRFTSLAQKPAAGFVRAKTGTLNGVVNLVGIVPDVDGRVLVFSVLTNGIASIERTRKSVDSIATKLRACGCVS
jgi:D-alanyl-D-alanine carboxypeptidase/D-alanyl-D-alanine-endopeptidase (penicillin-binding protein 4)